MLNRSAIIVRPKQPYLDWALALNDSNVVPDRDGEQTIYLVPEYDDDSHAEQILEAVSYSKKSCRAGIRSNQVGRRTGLTRCSAIDLKLSFIPWVK